VARFLLVRLSHAVLVVFGVSVVAFGLMHLSGDPPARTSSCFAGS
jgi:ABC-type dipeptide/oligopeptide/nickel transport system permease component